MRPLIPGLFSTLSRMMREGQRAGALASELEADGLQACGWFRWPADQRARPPSLEPSAGASQPLGERPTGALAAGRADGARAAEVCSRAAGRAEGRRSGGPAASKWDSMALNSFLTLYVYLAGSLPLRCRFKCSASAAPGARLLAPMGVRFIHRNIIVPAPAAAVVPGRARFLADGSSAAAAAAGPAADERRRAAKKWARWRTRRAGARRKVALLLRPSRAANTNICGPASGLEWWQPIASHGRAPALAQG